MPSVTCSEICRVPEHSPSILWFRQEGNRRPSRSLSIGITDQVAWKYNTANPDQPDLHVYVRKVRRTIIENGSRRAASSRSRGLEGIDPRQPRRIYRLTRILIAANQPTLKGAVRNGGALLTGLLRCGTAPANSRSSIRGTAGWGAISARAGGQTEGTTCISFGAADVDEAIAAAVLRAVQPLGVEARSMRSSGAQKGSVRTRRLAA